MFLFANQDPRLAESYRPVAPTSHVGKIIHETRKYNLESKEVQNNDQRGFRKGRSTIDSALCVENEIRKAQINKESSCSIS